MLIEPRPIGPALWEIPLGARPGMHVPARVVADEALMQKMRADKSLEQLVNVTTLPGLVDFAVGMPDMHEGYGFPVGGVAASALPDGAISPGGIGFDINCGVRLLRTGVPHAAVAGVLETLVHELSRSVPTGYGRGGRLDLGGAEIDQVLAHGARWVVEGLGLGEPEDLERCESGGALEGALPEHVSERARTRGKDQLGTLGGGNHFLEVGRVAAVFDEGAARALGLAPGDLTVLLHTGSRGLGHQVCTDHVRVMDARIARERIALVDRQLAWAPSSSPEGRAYFGAMCAAANFAWANRQVLTQRVREVFARVLGPAGLHVEVVYDVAHNIAKIESHGGRALCVHRKGATRALGPGEPDLPERYRAVGQPILIPGSMGTGSYVLVGTAEARARTFASTCHGAGRALSRTAARRESPGHLVRKALEARGIIVRCPSNAELAEEAPFAYKDIERVVEVTERAGIARKVARLVPLGVLKG